MARWRKTGLWLAGIVTVLLVLLSLVFILSRNALLASLKENLVSELCKDHTCRVNFEKLEIHLLPSPHITATNLQIGIPGVLSGTVKSLSASPRVLPLFVGRVELAELRLTSPQMEITLPDVSEIIQPGEPLLPNSGNATLETMASAGHSGLSTQDHSVTDGRQLPALSGSDIGARALSILQVLAEKAPGLHIRIRQGRIDFFHKARAWISLPEISADISLPPNNLQMRIECKSDLWEKLVLDGWFAPGESRGKGRINLDHFHSQALAEYLPADVPKPLGESPIDLDLSFSSDGPNIFNATFQGSIPSLTLQMGNEKSIIRNASVDGTLQMADGKLELRVSKFNVEDPQLGLSGQFLSDPKMPEAGYHLEIRNTDLAAVRREMRALLRENPVVYEVSDILRGGWVPVVVLQARGSSIADLQKLENLIVNGSLLNGQVFIPKVDLRVSDASGEVQISHGILEGKNLQGRTDNSTGRNGLLRIALPKDDDSFHLDIEIDADLAQLPPVLARVVDNEAFLKELALVRDVTGKAQGRLILGETLEDIQTRVEVNECDLKGLYERFPFPLELKASSFLYEGETVAIGSLQGRAGKSELLDVSGTFDWSRGNDLELTAPTKARISLDELFPWLTSFSEVKGNLWGIASATGTLQIDSLTFRGFLSRPNKWKFLLEGRIEDLVSHSDLLPDTLRIKTGTLVATPQNLQAGNLDFKCLDASMVASGKLNGYLAGLQSADFAFQGEIGPQAAEWVSDLAHLPTEFRARTPVSTPQARLIWERKGHTTLSGVFRVSGGPEVAIHLDHEAQELSIDPLTVEDGESNATFAVSIKEGELGLGFKGNLTGETLTRLFAESPFFSGSLTGDLTTRIIWDRLTSSTVDGTLMLKGLWDAPVEGMPLKAENVSLEAKGNILEVKTATLWALDQQLELKGSVGFADDHEQLDLDLVADGIDWNKLKEVYPLEKLGGESQGTTVEHGVTFRGTPVRGTLKIHAGHFSYDDYTWKPFGATLTFAQDGITIQLTEANLCSIPTPATIIPSQQGPLLIVKLDARNLALDPTLSCLWDKKGAITGAFDLEGEITAMIRQHKMSETFEGNLYLVARNGRVYRSTVLAKIFDLLNFTEIYRGHLPDLTHEGCAYDSIKARATLKNGKLLLKDSIFDGRCAKMIWTGEVDLTNEKMNFTVLVSPLKTVDTVIGHIPLVGGIMGGSLISIPVRVTGDLANPKVIPLSPSAVGSELLNTMRRVFRYPFSLIQPLK